MPTFIDPAFRGEAHDTELIPGGVVELRVHGVNGGSAQENLNDPHPIQVSGDDLVGFYRRREELATDAEPERTVEAYNWSAINSSASQRVWWVFLLPFAFANLAGWLLPKGFKTPRYGKDSTRGTRSGDYEGDWRRPWAQSVVRLIGLCVTGVVVLGLAEVFIDLLAVQCGGSSVCYDRFWLGWLEWMVDIDDLSTVATKRAVVFTLLPIGILAWIGWLGRRSGRYENYGAPTASDREARGPRMDHVTLREIEFWGSPRTVSIQRRLHLAAGLGLLAGTLGFVLRELSNQLPTESGGTMVGPHHGALLALALVGFGVFAASGIGLVAAHWLKQVPARDTDTLARIPYYAGIVVLAAVAFLGWDTPAELADPPPLEAVRNGLIGFATVGVVLVVMLGMLVRAFWLFTGIAGVGGLAFAVSWHEGSQMKDFVLVGGSATTWLAVEAGIALAGLVLYRVLGPPGDGPRHESTVWIYVGLALSGVAGVAAFMRDPSTVYASVVILVLYLFIQFATQVRWGDDKPASEKMRVGIAAVMAGLALTTSLTLSSGAAVFVAQRLGFAVPHSNGPVLSSSVEGYIEKADIEVVGPSVLISGDLQVRDPGSPFSPFGGEPVVIGSRVAAIDTQIRDDFVQVDNGVGEVSFVEFAGSQVSVDPAGIRLELRPLAARVEDDRLLIGDAFVIIEEGRVIIDGRAIVYPAEMGWYAIAAVFGLIVFLASIALRLLVLYLFRWGSLRGFWGPKGKGHDLSGQYDDDWTAMSESEQMDKYDISDERKKKTFAKKATRNRLWGNITDDADWLITAAVLTTTAVLSAVITMRLMDTVPASDLVGVIGLASFAIAAVWIGLIWVVRQAKSSVGVRRWLGILWDVTAYFPRRFHPLAPPCYAEQSVIDIRDRIIQIRKHGGKIVVVSHSEGTLLTTTALMTLYDQRDSATVIQDPAHPHPSGNELAEIYHVTYGCMLQRLFGRAWPDQLPLSDLHELKRRLGDDLEHQSAQRRNEFPSRRPGQLARWMNLGRYTDYLGGRVFSPLQAKPSQSNRAPEEDRERCDDIFFQDPPRRWRFVGQSEYARVWTHSFSADSDAEDPRFRCHVWGVLGSMNDPGSAPSPVEPRKQSCVCHPED